MQHSLASIEQKDGIVLTDPTEMSSGLAIVPAINFHLFSSSVSLYMDVDGLLL